MNEGIDSSENVSKINISSLNQNESETREKSSFFYKKKLTKTEPKGQQEVIHESEEENSQILDESKSSEKHTKNDEKAGKNQVKDNIKEVSQEKIKKNKKNLDSQKLDESKNSGNKKNINEKLKISDGKLKNFSEKSKTLKKNTESNKSDEVKISENQKNIDEKVVRQLEKHKTSEYSEDQQISNKILEVSEKNVNSPEKSKNSEKLDANPEERKKVSKKNLKKQEGSTENSSKLYKNSLKQPITSQNTNVERLSNEKTKEIDRRGSLPPNLQKSSVLLKDMIQGKLGENLKKTALSLVKSINSKKKELADLETQINAKKAELERTVSNFSDETLQKIEKVKKTRTISDKKNPSDSTQEISSFLKNKNNEIIENASSLISEDTSEQVVINPAPNTKRSRKSKVVSLAGSPINEENEEEFNDEKELSAEYEPIV